MLYREPDINIGAGENKGKPPHLTGKDFLKYFGFQPGTLEAYAYTSDDFLSLAKKYGKVGGYAHIASIVKRIRAEREGKVLFIDPHFIAFCPYKINVYILPEDEKKVYLSYRRLIWYEPYGAYRWKDESGKDVLRPVERLLEDIINDVLRIQKEYQ